MNWIEIDRLLYKIIERHSSADGMYAEACKTFKWDQSQARAAIDPLLKRNTDHIVAAKSATPRSNKLRKK
jgi:hypothetical protein